MKTNIKFNRAFSLLETLVAISIFTVSLLGIMSVLASSISSTSYAKQKMVATYLAQEGIEHTRNLRDTSVLSSASRANGWVAFKTTTDITYGTNVTGFTRIIKMMNPNGSDCPCGGDEVKITSDVSWKQGSGTFHITFSENLFNWIE